MLIQEAGPSYFRARPKVSHRFKQESTPDVRLSDNYVRHLNLYVLLRTPTSNARGTTQLSTLYWNDDPLKARLIQQVVVS